MAPPRWLAALLKLEWAGIAIAMIVVYTVMGWSWLAFAILVLAPDLSMLGYLSGPRVGALSYNLGHTLIVPLAIAGVGWFTDTDRALQVAVIWIFHVAFDRALGYGLKLPTAFQDTHLGRIGKAGAEFQS